MSKHYIRTYPNRTWCEVLEEMRKCFETHNYAPILSLIEELQTFGNRMEAALNDQKDAREARKTISEAKKELIQLKAEIEANQELKKLIKK